MRPESRLVLVPIVLAVLLATAALPAAAGPSRAASPGAEAAPAGSGFSLVDRLWSWIGSFWPNAGHALAPATTSRGPRPDFGCGIDPGGQCQSPAPARPAYGCGIDPNGRCQPPAPIRRPSAGAVRRRPG